MLSIFERRMEIINIIKDEKKVSASQLAKRTGVSIRTIRRDIDAISAFLPIYCDGGRKGGVRLVEDKPMNAMGW